MRARHNNAEVDRLIRSLPAAVAVLEGPAHMVRYHNEHYRQLTQAPAPIVGLTIAMALPELVEQGFVALLDEVYSSGRPYTGNEVEIELDRANGLETLYINLAYVPRRAEDGTVDGVVVHAVDVTELVHGREHSRALAQQLAVERSRLAQVLEQLDAGVAIADGRGQLLLANRGWRDVFEVASEDVTSISGIEDYARFDGFRPDGSRYAPEEFPIARSLLSDELVTNERIHFRFESGRERTVDVSARRVAGLADDPVAAMVTTIDVTDQLTHQRELADAERRRAYEVNDTVVQRLAVADLAFDLGETDEARQALRDALAITKQLISEWGARADDLSLVGDRTEVPHAR